MTAPFIPVKGQSFKTFDDWVNTATYFLTDHPDYNNTEHHGPKTGWRGDHFVAMCFDQTGRRCKNGKDMARARDENSFPVWWVWPDQIAVLIMGAKK